MLLASSSPRRRELLALLGLPFDVTSADVDETPLDGESPRDMALRLARAKAQCVAQAAPPGVIVIAADTTGALDDIPLGKPADAADAERMLRALRGRVHQVYTAIILVKAHSDQSVCDLATTDVLMRRYSDEEMYAYIASGDPLDKAAAYAIQHSGFHPVESLNGCLANVMGLPLCHLTRSLRGLNVIVNVDVPAACQQHLGYRCPVYVEILNGSLSEGPAWLTKIVREITDTV